MAPADRSLSENRQALRPNGNSVTAFDARYAPETLRKGSPGQNAPSREAMTRTVRTRIVTSSQSVQFFA